ncbi:anthrone oxygenase family protein [Crossiella cryophila]|uniref:Putative membrane protein n=1 Tax=Crossiella cryophila TaxID=43355 RepID=A0A7W7CDK7_9PSEU|nr:anthrone oxygenase family protein [Crossiella cryophila]MBB4679225.1 putative membrane protein [Crossiella cryophila]
MIALTVVAESTTAILTGLFFTFSAVVMPALAKRPAQEAAEVMRQVNRTIVNPLFLLAFLGAPISSAVLAVLEGFPLLPTIAAVLVVGGMLAVTAIVNVPMNNALDAADPATPAGQELWRGFLRRWTGWNHLRTIACLGATVLYALA